MRSSVEYQPPTHTLVVEIPIHIDPGKTLDIDPVQDALRITLALSRLATLGVLCGVPQATIRDEP